MTWPNLETKNTSRNFVVCVLLTVSLPAWRTLIFPDSFSYFSTTSYRFRCADAYEPQLLGYVADALNDGNNDTSSADCHGET